MMGKREKEADSIELEQPESSKGKRNLKRKVE